MLGTPRGARMAPELRPEGPDKKSTPSKLISMKNWRGRVGNSSLKWQIGRGSPGQMCFSIRMAEICVFWVKQPPQKTVVVVFMYVGMPPYYLNSVTISVQIDLGKDGQPGSDLRGAWLRPLQPTNWTETLRCHKTSFANILRGRAAEVQAFNKVSNWAQTIYISLKNQLTLLYFVSASSLIGIQRLPE